MQQQQLLQKKEMEQDATNQKVNSPKQPMWVRRIQASINGIRKDLSAWAEIKRNEIKTQNMKRKRLLRKYNTGNEDNLDQVMTELKLKVSAKTQ